MFLGAQNCLVSFGDCFVDPEFEHMEFASMCIYSLNKCMHVYTHIQYTFRTLLALLLMEDILHENY